MSYISNEFIYFDPDFKGQYGDFTDNTVFTPQERYDFLRNYAKYLKKSYSLPEKSQYAVNLAEVKEKLGAFRIDTGVFAKVKAYKSHMPKKFKNWNLYTQKAVVKENKLVLKSADLPPNPCAEYFLDGERLPNEIFLKFKMDSEYKAGINGIMRDTTTARTIELKKGMENILKISFYSNGECYARHYSNDPYHCKFISIGNFVFDEINELRLILHSDSFDIYLNEQAVFEIAFNSNKISDSLFFSTGMFHFGDWEIEPILIRYGNEEINDFFETEIFEIKEKEYIGEVTLPYAIGCQENSGKQLIIEKEFTVPDLPHIRLHFDSLDPGGEIYIDGALMASVDRFDSFDLDISYLDKNKSHLLQVIVFPRAPEELYGWHGQNDRYNGWFCGEIELKYYGEVRFTDLKCVTRYVSENGVGVAFSGRATAVCDIEISVEKVFGGNDCEKKITAFNTEGDFVEYAEFEADAWDINTPNLYKITFTASKNGRILGMQSIETGFRTIEQKNGEIILNGRRVDLKGALLMQFLPPHSQTTQSHICPSDEEVLWQEMMLKALGGNTLRLHILGYGTNDARYARYADRLGILLIWTTRYIDTLESVQWQGKWRGRDGFLNQIKERINHPSIIMWEGSNELRADLKEINDGFEQFVSAVKKVDSSRLICPVSHLYYAGELYPTKNCGYYTNDGKFDHNGNPVQATSYWTDELVVRSAHTYSLLCGYGTGWDRLRTQPWKEQESLLESKERAYIVSEFAVIGRQDPNTREAKEKCFNPFSYEFSDEKILGIDFGKEDWLESQAYQALCAHNCIKKIRLLNADGMLWCCLMGGANDGGYLKPIIDNYGYAKLGFYAMRAAFGEICAFIDDTEIKRGTKISFTTALMASVGEKYNVTVYITDADGNTLEEKIFSDIFCKERITKLPIYESAVSKSGFYGIRFKITKG